MTAHLLPEEMEEIRLLRVSRRWSKEELCELFNITLDDLKEILDGIDKQVH